MMVDAIDQPRRKRRRANRNKRTAATATTISDLPNHIISDILSRVPLKSILICKRVSKTWRNLILEPCFPKLHLSRSPPLCFLFHRRCDTTNPSHFGILQLDDDDLTTLGRRNSTMKFRTGIHLPRCYLDIVGSCNGLICLRSARGNTVIVCNPIRGEHFTLPKPPKRELVDGPNYGFGYSPRTDQYKVVILTSSEQETNIEHNCDVYTLGTDVAWRSIRDTGHPNPLFSSNLMFLNGALHWVGWQSPCSISYFDMEREQFGNLPLPFEIAIHDMVLGVVDNCLYISDENSLESPVSIWVMKDYRCIGSWRLEWVIDRRDGAIKPAKILKDGTVLMIVGDKTVASYNPERTVLEKVNYHGIRFWSELVAYVPSFLSPWML